MTYEDLLTQRRILEEMANDDKDDWPFRLVGPSEPCGTCSCPSFVRLGDGDAWQCANCGEVARETPLGHSAAS